MARKLTDPVGVVKALLEGEIDSEIYADTLPDQRSYPAVQVRLSGGIPDGGFAEVETFSVDILCYPDRQRGPVFGARRLAMEIWHVLKRAERRMVEGEGFFHGATETLMPTQAYDDIDRRFYFVQSWNVEVSEGVSDDRWG